MKLLCESVCLAALFCALSAHALNIDSVSRVTPAAARVPKYTKLELLVSLSGVTATKFYDPDPAQQGLDLYAEFTDPANTVIRVNGFYDGTSWRIRFSPTAEGAWSYVVKAADAGGTATSTAGSFQCIPSTHAGFLRIDGFYFRFSEGQPFFGVGHNTGWQYENPDDIEEPVEQPSLATMAANGMNLLSFWMATPWAQPSWGMGTEPFWRTRAAIENTEDGIGNYNQYNCQYMDELLTRAEANGVYLLPSLWAHDQLRAEAGNPSGWGPGNWSNNAYSLIDAPGGARKITADEFYITQNAGVDTTQWRYQKNFFRYIVARWGYSRALLGWVGVVEINGTRGWPGTQTRCETWNASVRNYLASLDHYRLAGGKYPFTTTRTGGPTGNVTSSINTWSPGWDVQARDSYTAYRDDINIASDLAFQALQMRTTGKPSFFAEFGGDTNLANTPHATQPLHVHNGIWAGTAAGTCLTPLLWTDIGDFPKLNETPPGPAMRDQFKFLSQFMSTIDYIGHPSLTSAATTSNAGNCRGWTTRTADRGFCWIQCTTGNTGQAGQSLTISGLTNGSYIVEWFDTWNTISTPFQTENLTASSTNLVLAPKGAGRADVVARFRLNNPVSWDGGGGANTNWSRAQNWDVVGGITGSATTSARFPALASPYTANNDTASFDLNQMIFDSSAAAANTISGNSIEMLGVNPEIIQKNSGPALISAPLVLTESLTLSGSGTGAVTISGAISGSKSLIKSSSGTTYLNGANTYTGQTRIVSGTLSGTGSLASTVVVTSGGTLAPGAAGAVGTLAVGGATFYPGSTLAIRIPTSTSSDVLDLSSGVLTVMDGAKLNLDLTGLGAVAKEFVVAKYNTGTGPSFIVNVTGNALNQTVAMSYRTDLTPREVRVAIGISPTPVRLVSFEATSHSHGTLLTWTTASEFRNAGYNLYRRSADASAWVKLNRTLIPGKLTTPEFSSYCFYDWDAAPFSEYLLESVDFDGKAERLQIASSDPCHPDDGIAAEFNLLSAAIDAALAERSQVRAAKVATLSGFAGTAGVPPALRSAGFQPASIGSPNASGRTVSQGSSPVGTSEPRSVVSRSVEQVGDAVKLVHAGSGVLWIAQESLPAGFDARFVSVRRGGEAVTVLYAGADGLALFAPGYRDAYTAKDVFFLRRSETPTAVTRAPPAKDLFNQPQPQTSTLATVTRDFHEVYFDWSLAPYTFTPWFSKQYLTDGALQSFTLDLPQCRSEAATLSVNVWTLNDSPEFDPDHALIAVVNGVSAGRAEWDGGGRALSLSFDVPAGVLRAGENTIELLTPDLRSGQIAFLHSVSMSYSRALSAAASFSVSAAGNNQLIEISGCASDALWIFSASNPQQPVAIGYESRRETNGTFFIRFIAPVAGGNYHVIARESQIAPLAVSLRKIAPPPQAGYLATGPAQFAEALQPLLEQRNAENLNAVFADQETLFDYFGHGRFGPDPIRAAVRALRPRFLLLVGRTTYDYLDYEGAGLDPLCPSFFASTSYLSQTLADPLFGDLGNGFCEVAIGRLPVNTPGELNAAVARTLSYAGLPESGQRAFVAADRTDPQAGNFAAQAESLITANPDIAWSRAFVGITHAGPQEVNEALAQASATSDLLLYNGHGNSRVLGREMPRILDVSSVQSWSGNSVLLQSTCNGNWTGRNEAGFRSIASQALIQPQGGIAASISTTTFIASEPAIAFFSKLLSHPQSPDVRWGDALLKTQQWAFDVSRGSALSGWYADLARTECILGDPALPMYRSQSASAIPSPPLAPPPQGSTVPSGVGGAQDGDGGKTEAGDGSGPRPLPPISMSVSRLRGRLNFASTDRSSVSLAGRVPEYPLGSSPAPKTVRLMIGGYSAEAQLDARGRGRSSSLHFHLLPRASFGMRTFRAVVRGALTDALRDEGLTPGSKLNALLSVELKFDSLTHAVTVPIDFHAGNKSGRFKEK